MDGMPESVSAVMRTDADEFVAALGIFDQVNGRKHAQRHGNQQRQKRHDDRVDQRRHKRDVFGIVVPGEQLGCEVRQPFDKDVPDQSIQQHGQDGGERRPARSRAQRTARYASDLQRAYERLLSFIAAALLFSRRERERLMIRIKTNSTTAVAISAPRCRSAA